MHAGRKKSDTRSDVASYLMRAYKQMPKQCVGFLEAYPEGKSTSPSNSDNSDNQRANGDKRVRRRRSDEVHNRGNWCGYSTFNQMFCGSIRGSVLLCSISDATKHIPLNK